MDCEGALHAFERALVDHQLGAAEAFLARLEEQPDAAAELRAPLMQQLRRSEQHRHMAVVPARMHAPVDL